MSNDHEIRELKLQLKEAQFELKKLKFESLLKQCGLNTDGAESPEPLYIEESQLGLESLEKANKKAKKSAQTAEDEFARSVYKELTVNESSWDGCVGWDKRVNIFCPSLTSNNEVIIECSSINLKSPLASLLFDNTPGNPVDYPLFSFWLAHREERLPKLDLEGQKNGQNADFKLFIASEFVHKREWIQVYGPGTHPMLNIVNGVLTLGHFVNCCTWQGSNSNSTSYYCANNICEHYKNECPVHRIGSPTPGNYSILHRTDNQPVRFHFRLSMKWEAVDGALMSQSGEDIEQLIAQQLSKMQEDYTKMSEDILGKIDTLAERVDTLQSNINLLLEQAELDEQALQLSQEPAAQGEENSMQ